MKKNLTIGLLLTSIVFYAQIGTSMSRPLENPYKQPEFAVIKQFTKEEVKIKEEINIADSTPKNTSNKKYNELSDVEKITQKSKQLKEEQDKLKKEQELLNEKRYWERIKKQKKAKSQNEIIIDDEIQDYDNLINSSNISDFNDILSNSEINSLKILHKDKAQSKNILIKKQIKILNKQNYIIKNELIGLLNPAEYKPHQTSIDELKNNNAELKIFFPPSGLNSLKINDEEQKKILYDLISLNYALKNKLIELLRINKDENFNQSILEEFYYSSESLINFTEE